LGVEKLEDIGNEIERIFKKITAQNMGFFNKLSLLGELKEISRWMPKKLNKRGVCQEVIMKDADLTKLPVLTCWPHDGGPFITLPAVHTICPDSGITNVGMYRMQVYDINTTGMHWHLHKDAARHFNMYKERKKLMPVSVSIGGDPVYSYVASAPLPENINEYILAGFLRKKHVELVKCVTNELYVPADADFVLEGYIDTEADFKLEGPFGDHTGFYSLADFYPVFHVTCITHRKEAVYPATVVGIPPQEDAWMGKATERIFLTPIRLSMLPEVVDMSLPVEGVFHNIAIVKIKSHFDGHAFKVMNSLWGAGQMMLNKILAVVDESVDLDNPKDLFKKIIENTVVSKDILISRGPLDVLDHSTDVTGFGGKIGFSATHKNTGAEEYLQCDIIISALKALSEKNQSIVGYNTELIEEGISLLIIAVKKEDAHTINNLKQSLLNEAAFRPIKFVLFIEHLIHPNDYKDVVWRSANNVEPSRDCDLNSTANKLFIDATMKSKDKDGFKKDWPNIICTDADTIKLVDSKWHDYNIGDFIASPSLKYSKLKYSEGAVITE